MRHPSAPVTKSLARLALLLVAALAATCLAAASASAASAPVWLCKPGTAPDPCTPGLATTVYNAKLKKLGI